LYFPLSASADAHHFRLFHTDLTNQLKKIHTILGTDVFGFVDVLIRF